MRRRQRAAVCAKTAASGSKLPPHWYRPSSAVGHPEDSQPIAPSIIIQPDCANRAQVEGIGTDNMVPVFTRVRDV